MTPSAGVAAWPKSSRSPSGRWIKIVFASAVAILFASYLAGAFFLWSMHADPREATLLTLGRYGYYYGDRPEIRRRLCRSSALALVLVGVSAGAGLLPRRRPLHGDARFASRGEIAAAGLLGSEGIILGKRGTQYLMLAGQQGVALAAPPRAGKGTGVVVPNALKRYNFNNHSALTKEPDGSLKITIGAKPVAGVPESNWLPAPNGKPFSLTFRTYVPKDDVKQGRWTPPAVTKVN